MNIRTAILKAADSIEQNPHLFYFHSVDMPDAGCGTPGCALGWIGHHLSCAGIQPDDRFDGSLSRVAHMESTSFYARMNGLEVGLGWKYSAPACASALRQYADKYHPENRGIPESVRQIFELEVA